MSVKWWSVKLLFVESPLEALARDKGNKEGSPFLAGGLVLVVIQKITTAFCMSLFGLPFSVSCRT